MAVASLSNSTSIDDIAMRVAWTRVSAIAVAICFCLNLLDGMDILIMSYIAEALTLDWKLSAASLGIVFSAATFGMMIGAMLIAPLADVIGRRPVIIGALTTMAICMVWSSFSTSIEELVILRLAVGMGIGTMLASMSAITSEFAPAQHRNFAVALLQAAYPLGAVITGLVTYWALPLFGWRHVLAGGGFVTLALIPLAVAFMPESLEFLIKRQPKGTLEKITKVRLQMGLTASSPLRAGKITHRAVPNPFKDRWAATILLWLSFFSVYLTLYFVIAWIPKLAIQAGLAASQGILAGTSYNLGAFVGAAALAWAAMRISLHKLILCMMLLGAVMMVVFAIPATVPVVIGVAFLIGVFVFGGFAGIYPLAARTYPAEVRSSGIGWAIGIGRAGAVVGPALGGYLISIHTTLITLFLLFAVPLLTTGVFSWFVRPDAAAAGSCP